MRDQLPKQPNKLETGIINLDKRSGPGTHWVSYAVDPRGIVYFDSYGLAPPVEFIKYVAPLHATTRGSKVWYSTLPTQTMTDPPICGREVINVLDAISKSSRPPHKVVHDYTSNRYVARKAF